jgi:sigma54-dependent transcription regulator
MGLHGTAGVHVAQCCEILLARTGKIEYNIARYAKKLQKD